MSLAVLLHLSFGGKLLPADLTSKLLRGVEQTVFLHDGLTAEDLAAIGARCRPLRQVAEPVDPEAALCFEALVTGFADIPIVLSVVLPVIIQQCLSDKGLVTVLAFERLVLQVS